MQSKIAELKKNTKTFNEKRMSKLRNGKPFETCISFIKLKAANNITTIDRKESFLK
jgi:hypothetical protein